MGSCREMRSWNCSVWRGCKEPSHESMRLGPDSETVSYGPGELYNRVPDWKDVLDVGWCAMLWDVAGEP